MRPPGLPKMFLHPLQLKGARDAGYIIDEPDGTMTLQAPLLPNVEVIETKPLPLMEA